MITKILFASDFTATAGKAETYAQSFASINKAKVTVLHAVEPIVDADKDAAVSRFLERKQTAAGKNAEVVAQRFRDAGVESDVAVVVGKRWKAIIDHAKAGDYDLVVIGANNTHDGDKVYMGTTTQKVFFAADMPLLVVPT